MSDLREAAQQALEALEEYQSKGAPFLACDGAVAALRAALAQQEEPEAYGYASRLAVAIWEKHYKDTAPQWKPLDYLIGVLTQIDNMTSGLTRQAQQEEPQTLDEAMRLPRAMAQAYENGYKAGAAAERKRIIQFLTEMQRQVGDGHNYYGVAAMRISEMV